MLMPDRIIDAHHHLWDLQACTYPWLEAKGVERFFGDPAPIQKNYLPDDFRADFAALPVEKSVHIQVGVSVEQSLAETAWLQAQGERTGFPSAIVAFCDLTDPDYEANLEAHSAHDRLRGIRQIVGRSAKEDQQTGTANLLQDQAFAEGLKRLAERGLSFDLQLTPPLMDQAAKLLSRIEALPVAVCHAGSPYDHSQDGKAAWKTSLAELARHENTICKLSGFGMFQHAWTEASIRDYVLTAIDIFGPQRIAFGSNFPVDKLYASYTRTLGAYLNLTADFSPRDRDQMFAGTAEAFYRL